jgi:hypothetical protein
MDKKRHILITGRNNAPLTDIEVRRATNTFYGFDKTVPVRFDPDSISCFHIAEGEIEGEYGEIVIGPDIYPGAGIIDPNSTLSLNAAAAHEIAHYHRWLDKRELPHGVLTFLDEALTSLEAILRFHVIGLNDTDVKQLISDAHHRIRLYINSLDE